MVLAGATGKLGRAAISARSQLHSRVYVATGRAHLHGERNDLWTTGSVARLFSTTSISLKLAASSQAKSFQSDCVRKLMRHVPHPVAIVTASPRGEDGPSSDPKHWRGATVSSFVTVALDPQPVVCFNIKHDSSTFTALESSTEFNVHVLRRSPEAETIATKFASGNALEPFHDGEGELEWWVQRPRSETSSAPIIDGEQEEVEEESGARSVVMFRLHCSYLKEKTVQVGDHVVVFGEVSGADHDQLRREHASLETRPQCLLYVDGRYTSAAG